MARTARLWCESELGKGRYFLLAAVLVLPFVVLFKAMQFIFSGRLNKINNKNNAAYGLEADAKPYVILIDALCNIFPQCHIEDIGEGKRKSGNSINFVFGNKTLVSIRAASHNIHNGKKNKFNSDSTGLAVGFRDDVMEKISVKHLQFIGREQKWNFYRIASVEDVQLLRS